MGIGCFSLLTGTEISCAILPLFLFFSNHLLCKCLLGDVPYKIKLNLVHRLTFAHRLRFANLCRRANLVFYRDESPSFLYLLIYFVYLMQFKTTRTYCVPALCQMTETAKPRSCGMGSHKVNAGLDGGEELLREWAHCSGGPWVKRQRYNSWHLLSGRHEKCQMPNTPRNQQHLVWQ